MAAVQQPALAAPHVSTREDRTALSVMVTSHAVQHFYVAGLALTYPLVVDTFHISYGVLGAVLAIAGLVGGLLQGAAGLMSRVSARLILTLQNVGLGIACAAAAVVPGFALFGAARCFGALVSWPQHPVGSAYLAERFPQRRAAVLSWHTAGGSLGTVVVPLFTSAIIALAGWRWALVALAIPLAAGGLLVLAKLPPERAAAASRPASSDASARPAARSAWAVLRQRRVLLVLIASTVAAGGRGLGTVSTFVPAYLQSDLKLGQFAVGGVFTVVLAASVVGPIAAGYLADRIGRMRVTVLAYAGGAASLASFVLVGANLAALFGAGLALGMLAYAESPLLQAVFADAATGADQRTTFGFFFAIAYGVGALWLALLGWVIDVLGFQAAFFTMAGSFVVAGILVALAARAPETAPTS
ncbi:MAG TPA: MFS transporter [Chloroflexota bacterium]|nr:MFS transporter [Chloroflexota bacterium]